MTELISAMDRWDLEEIERLIKTRPDLVNSIHSRGRTPLHIAGRQCDCLEVLINAGANIDARNTKEIRRWTPCYCTTMDWARKKPRAC